MHSPPIRLSLSHFFQLSERAMTELLMRSSLEKQLVLVVWRDDRRVRPKVSGDSHRWRILRFFKGRRRRLGMLRFFKGRRRRLGDDGSILWSVLLGVSSSLLDTKVAGMLQRAANAWNSLYPEVVVKQIPMLLLLMGTYLCMIFPLSPVHLSEMAEAEMEQLALESSLSCHYWENTWGMKMFIGASGKYLTLWKWNVWTSLRSSSTRKRIDPMPWVPVVSPLTPRTLSSSFSLMES